MHFSMLADFSEYFLLTDRYWCVLCFLKETLSQSWPRVLYKTQNYPSFWGIQCPSSWDTCGHALPCYFIMNVKNKSPSDVKSFYVIYFGTFHYNTSWTSTAAGTGVCSVFDLRWHRSEGATVCGRGVPSHDHTALSKKIKMLFPLPKFKQPAVCTGVTAECVPEVKL